MPTEGRRKEESNFRNDLTKKNSGEDQTIQDSQLYNPEGVGTERKLVDRIRKWLA